MGLKFDGSRIVLLVKRLADVERLAFQLKVILHQHAVQSAVTYAGVFTEPSSLNVGAVHTTS